MQNKNGTIVSQNSASNPVIRLVRTLDSYADIDYTFDAKSDRSLRAFQKTHLALPCQGERN